MASSVNTSATRSGACASIARFHRSRASRKASVSGTLTTIHVQDLAGDEVRVLQIQHGPDDVADLTHAPHWMHLCQSFVGPWVMHGGANVSESDRVGPDAVHGVLDGQCLGH